MSVWLAITSYENWETVKNSNIWGVPIKNSNLLKKVKINDKIIFYVKKRKIDKNEILSNIPGIFQVISDNFIDETPLFKPPIKTSNEIFPMRIKLKPIKIFFNPLVFSEHVNRLDFIKNKEKWTGQLQTTMISIPDKDLEYILSLN